MEQPPRFVNPQTPNLVYILHKALYRLKQAPHAWFEKLHGAFLPLVLSQQNQINLYLLKSLHKTISIYLSMWMTL